MQRAQAAPGELQVPPSPGPIPPVPAASAPDDSIPSVGGQSLSLQAALYGTLTSNPDLATLRLGNPTTPSAEAVEVARALPDDAQSHLWCDLRPITLIPPDPFGGGGQRTGSYYKFGQFYFYLSLRQPIELGHQTTHRYAIAKAAYKQQQWTVVQAELTALVQTYRFFQTAAYRREKLRVAARARRLQRPAPADPASGGSRPTRSPPPTSSWRGSRAGRPASWSRRPSRTTSPP